MDKVRTYGPSVNVGKAKVTISNEANEEVKNKTELIGSSLWR
jgi:hypothetical protein